MKFSPMAIVAGAALFAGMLMTDANAGQQNCDCYMDGYAAGAMASRPGAGPVPQRCMIQGVTQVPRQSTWSYSMGYSYGINLESRVFAKTRANNRKWASDRAAEHQRFKRLMCY